jgi:MSHA biogenesis protein MshK
MAGLVSKRGLAFLLCLLAGGGALAAGDPTRPPAAWLNPADQQPGNAGGLRLQSVLMPQRGRPVAIIGGQTVALGERVGDARLIRLSEREAVLQGPDGVTRLYLTPDVDKRMIDAPAANKARQPAHGKEKR